MATLTKTKIGVIVDNMNMSDHHVALDAGYYRDEGLDVELVVHLGTLAELDTGAMLVSSSMPQILEAIIMRQAPYKFVLVTRQEPPHYLLGKPGIKSAADLKGKEIWASGEGAFNHYMAVDWLKSHGLEPGRDVTLSSPSSSQESFFNGKYQPWAGHLASLTADALMAVPPESEWLMQEAGYNQLVELCEAYPHRMIHALTAHEDTLKRHPELVRAAVRAHVRASKTIQGDRETTVQVWMNRWGVNRKVGERIWEFMNWRFIAETDPKWLVDTLAYASQHLQRRYPDKNIQAPSAASLIDPSFAPAMA